MFRRHPERLRGITPKMILYAAKELATLQGGSARNRVCEEGVVAKINAVMPHRGPDWLFTEPRMVPYGVRLRVKDMVTHIAYLSPDPIHSGPVEEDVRFISFQPGSEHSVSTPDTNQWYLEVINPRQGWKWYIDVNHLQDAGHYKNPLPQSADATSR